MWIQCITLKDPSTNERFPSPERRIFIAMLATRRPGEAGRVPPWPFLGLCGATVGYTLHA